MIFARGIQLGCGCGVRGAGCAMRASSYTLVQILTHFGFKCVCCGTNYCKNFDAWAFDYRWSLFALVELIKLKLISSHWQQASGLLLLDTDKWQAGPCLWHTFVVRTLAVGMQPKSVLQKMSKSRQTQREAGLNNTYLERVFPQVSLNIYHNFSTSSIANFVLILFEL